MNLDGYLRVYEKYYKLACKTAYDALKDYHLAGDVAQEVFIKMFEIKEKLNEEDIKYWIILTTYRHTLDAKRKAHRRREVSLLEEDENLYLNESKEYDVEFQVLNREEIDTKKMILDELKEKNPKGYKLLTQLYVDGMKYSTLAKLYGVPAVNLRMQVHRVRKWLDERIEKLYGD